MPAEQEKTPPISSSTPPAFPPEQQALFREVLTLMNTRRIPYVVSGAFALRQHTGIWRDTKDLDLFMPPEHANLALEYLKQNRFDVEVADSIWLAKARRNGYFVDLITGMSNAVVLVDHSWIERGTAAEVLGVPSRVLAAEELVASKIFVTRRERFDGADIAHVLYRAGSRMDWDRLLELVGEHWELLFWALILFHYVYPFAVEQVPQRIWGDLLSRFRQSLEESAADAPFRGSLVDDKMFAIDVSEWGLSDLMSDARKRRLELIRKPQGDAA